MTILQISALILIAGLSLVMAVETEFDGKDDKTAGKELTSRVGFPYAGAPHHGGFYGGHYGHLGFGKALYGPPIHHGGYHTGYGAFPGVYNVGYASHGVGHQGYGHHGAPYHGYGGHQGGHFGHPYGGHHGYPGYHYGQKYFG